MAAHEQDDTLHLHMALDTVNSLQKKNRGLVTFAVSDYAEMKEFNQTLQCPSFYTHPEGYHMAIEVDPYSCDEGEGTHLGISVLFLEGEHDSTLKWPFLGSVAVTLLNQLEDSDHYTDKLIYTSGDNFRVHFKHPVCDFISNAELGYNPVKNTQYLKDDTLYFRVEVEVDDYKPWLQCTAK